MDLDGDVPPAGTLPETDSNVEHPAQGAVPVEGAPPVGTQEPDEDHDHEHDHDDQYAEMVSSVDADVLGLSVSTYYDDDVEVSVPSEANKYVINGLQTLQLGCAWRSDGSMSGHPFRLLNISTTAGENLLTAVEAAG